MDDNNILRVKDVYQGKPDAKDELIFQENLESFIESYVISRDFDINELLYGEKFYVIGYKGTGKTALLLYLQAKAYETNPSTCSSFILFKSHFNNINRAVYEKIVMNMIKAIDTDIGLLEYEQDFEYIWLWILLKQLVEDNEQCNSQIFEDNDNWRKFVRVIKSIKCDSNCNNMFAIPSKLKLGVSTSGMAECTLDFNQKENLKEYRLFISRIDEAISLLEKLSKTDVPHYIFIDELEVFFSSRSAMDRDLRMVRDLIISTKNLNTILLKNYTNIRIVCSVRTEVINSIQRFIPGKEINKIISGFSNALKWNYTNTNSISHPIFDIWLRRIALSEKNTGNIYANMHDVYQKWFASCNEDNSVYNILNRTWFRPRDIVRYITATKNTLHSDNTTYSQAVFDGSIDEYSRESLKEIREELNSTYTSDEIDGIISLLSGFKTQFRLDELHDRAKTFFRGCFSENQIQSIVNDLYRVGVLGNSSAKLKTERWQHTGFDSMVYGEGWLILVHRALWKTLSLETYSRPPSSRNIVIVNNSGNINKQSNINIDSITGNINIASQPSSYFKDRVITCKECGAEFVFPAEEQEFYAEKGFQNDPARCPECRTARKRQRSAEREMYTVVCAGCGCKTQVPFRPTEDRPVYCRDCYQKQSLGQRA
jgi:CxxC-x17-CxxC domain-containing protein